MFETVRVSGLLSASMLAVGVVLATPHVALASCVPPTLSVTPAEALAGSHVVVSGEFWAADCNDTGGPRAAPDHISIFFVQGGTHTPLTDLTAHKNYSFRMAVTIPADAGVAPAKIEARGDSSGTQSVAFGVTPPGTPVPDKLPSTGATHGLRVPVIVAVGALLVGLLLVTAARSPAVVSAGRRARFGRRRD
jgi:hypothetical protein